MKGQLCCNCELLEFEGVQYRTIDDVKRTFRVSERTIRKMIDRREVPAPPVVQHGTRSFRHFDDPWVEKFRALLDGKGRKSR
jgi:hypothetical protein